MVGAVCEIQLRKVDQETRDEANPESNPQAFSPQVAWKNSWQQDVEEQEKHFVVATKKFNLIVKVKVFIYKLTDIGTLCPCLP
jgi:hypothetical protein